MKKGFTLIEVLITTVIIGSLTILLFQTYQSITRIVVRIEHEKILQQEMLFFYQSLQNIADQSSIDFDAYSGAGIDLLATEGWTSGLFLKYGQSTFSIVNTGCTSSGCSVSFYKDGKNLQFFSSSLVFDSLIFKVMPYEKNVYEGKSTIDQIQAPAFVLYANIRIRKWSKDRPFRVSLDTQNFFNLRMNP